LPFSEIYVEENIVDMKNGHSLSISGMDMFKNAGVNTLELDVHDLVFADTNMPTDGNIIIELNESRKGKEIDIGDVMIVPAKYYFSYILEQDIRSFKIHLRIDNADKYNEILTGVIKGFVNATDSKNYIYSPDSEVREFLNRIDGTQENAYALSLLAVSSMIIVTLGLTGLMTIKIIRRKREIAICKTLGAKDIHVLCEVILECVAVTGIFGIIGVIASIFALKNVFAIGEGLYEIVISPGLSVLPVCISVLIGILASIVPLVKVKQSTPVEVLRNL
jgi:ABC-type antimicrobial peptide transport system permease subunit